MSISEYGVEVLSSMRPSVDAELLGTLAVVGTMSAFAIDPPVHLRAHPEQAIRSLDEAADVVREYARDHLDASTESVLHRLEGAVTFYEARDAANAFRAWAERAGFLLIPPEDR